MVVAAVTAASSLEAARSVQPHLKGFADVKGRILVVDATNTAFALQAKKILLGYGLKEGVDYQIKAIGRGAQRLQAMVDDKNNAAAIMNPPFSVQAVQMGMKSLGRTTTEKGAHTTALTPGGDATVGKWITDLKNRKGKAPAADAPKEQS